MARFAMKVAVLLALGLLAVPNAEAGGKGLIFGKGFLGGKGGQVNTDVQCTQSCSDVCSDVPSTNCYSVPYQTKVCSPVAVQSSKQVCNKVCTTTTTTTQSYGKGKGVTVVMGKGRHLMGGKGMILGSILGKGKGYVAPTQSTSCNDVCKDVPYTTYNNVCSTVTKTKQQCDTVYTKKCNSVCKPVCQKVTTVTTTQTMGKGFPIMLGKGKGH